MKAAKKAKKKLGALIARGARGRTIRRATERMWHRIGVAKRAAMEAQ